MWDTIEHRLALMELVVTGRLRQRQSQLQAWAWLSELPWTRKSTRRNELVSARPMELQRLLTQAWPEWKSVCNELEAAGLPINEKGWRRLNDILHTQVTNPLPDSLNQHTALAQVAIHSKAGMSQIRRDALQNVLLTHDGIVRLRPSAGLVIERGTQRLNARELAEALGELVVSERALESGTVFSGTVPNAILLVENLGPYQDIVVPESWLVAHVPGWNTVTVRLVLDRFPQVDVIHFGDLDPNGFRIYTHLKSMRPDLRWLVPGFWREYVDKKALTAEWPPDLNLANAPHFVQELAQSGIWMEQEAIVLDSRLADALIASLCN